MLLNAAGKYEHIVTDRGGKYKHPGGVIFTTQAGKELVLVYQGRSMGGRAGDVRGRYLLQ